ncbi:MAG: hypothetical protein WC781_00250 [Candidatus Pacearchaeota archaeon]|jgi:hypothetical protein
MKKESENIVVVCAYCNAINLNNSENPNWKSVNNKDYEHVMKEYGYVLSHGMCEPCFNVEMIKLENDHASEMKVRDMGIVEKVLIR